LKILILGASQGTGAYAVKAALDKGHERQEALVAQSGLEWVVARPSRLTDGEARGRFKKTVAIEPVPNAISRADTAHFILDRINDQATFGKTLILAN